MSAKSYKADKLQSTVIISDRFTERKTLAAAHCSAEPTVETLEPGSMVGRYLTLSRVGVGGMGVVYRAHDTELNRTVALKVLPPHLCKYPDYLKRFHTEAQAQARLNSPYVITLYELMEHSVGEILVLEYVEGETLEKRLRRYGALAVPEAVRLFEQTLCGVEHMHQMGVVHRDLKPSNIFITHEGEVKLMDFGIARLMENHDPSQKGTMVGTLLYIAPEQINGRETDCRSDVYTLGISLYEAVTGRLPFERRSDYALMHAHVQEKPLNPKEYQRRLPRELAAVIMKAIEKDPNRRFQTVVEFRAALLNLGFVERRQTPAANFISDMSTSSNRRVRDAISQIWGGAWLDLSLVAMALLLVIGLDLYPSPTASINSTVAQAVQTQKTTGLKSTLVTARRQANRLPTAGEGWRASTKMPKDKYASLREAWGG